MMPPPPQRRRRAAPAVGPAPRSLGRRRLGHARGAAAFGGGGAPQYQRPPWRSTSGGAPRAAIAGPAASDAPARRPPPAAGRGAAAAGRRREGRVIARADGRPADWAPASGSRPPRPWPWAASDSPGAASPVPPTGATPPRRPPERLHLRGVNARVVENPHSTFVRQVTDGGASSGRRVSRRDVVDPSCPWPATWPSTRRRR